MSEKESITAFRCLGLFLRTKKRGETLDTDIPFLMSQAPVRNILTLEVTYVNYVISSTLSGAHHQMKS